MSQAQLTPFANELQARLAKEVAVITHAAGSTLSILVLVGKGAQSQVRAPELMKELCELAGGKGGGRPDRAQGASPQPEKEDLVLRKAQDFLIKRFS